jgi:SAM-dependent methyltransferase
MPAFNPQRMAHFFRWRFRDGFGGKDVLDIGCNAGGTCFVAAEFGARRVVGFDVRQHWVNQATFMHDTKYAHFPGITFHVADAKTALKDIGVFDIVIFSGLFFHLPDPVHVLLQACEAARETIIVNTMTSDAIPEECLAPRWETIGPLLAGIDGLTWIPGGPRAIQPILSHAGFSQIQVNFWRHHVNGDTGQMELVGQR